MKFSEYPVGTIIDVTEDAIRYEKSEGGNWLAITGHCVDCMEEDYIPADEVDQKDAHVTAVPFGLAWQLAIMLADEYGAVDSEGEDITFDGIIADASEEYTKFLDREAKKGV